MVILTGLLITQYHLNIIIFNVILLLKLSIQNNRIKQGNWKWKLMNKYIYSLMYCIGILYYNVEVKISEMMQLLFHNLFKSLHLNNKWPCCISIRFKTYNFKRVLASSTLHFIKVYKLADNYSRLGYDAVLTGNLLPKFRRRLLPPALK